MKKKEISLFIYFHLPSLYLAWKPLRDRDEKGKEM